MAVYACGALGMYVAVKVHGKEGRCGCGAAQDRQGGMECHTAAQLMLQHSEPPFS